MFVYKLRYNSKTRYYKTVEKLFILLAFNFNLWSFLTSCIPDYSTVLLSWKLSYREVENRTQNLRKGPTKFYTSNMSTILVSSSWKVNNIQLSPLPRRSLVCVRYIQLWLMVEDAQYKSHALLQRVETTLTIHGGSRLRTPLLQLRHPFNI